MRHCTRKRPCCARQWVRSTRSPSSCIPTPTLASAPPSPGPSQRMSGAPAPGPGSSMQRAGRGGPPITTDGRRPRQGLPGLPAGDDAEPQIEDPNREESADLGDRLVAGPSDASSWPSERRASQAGQKQSTPRAVADVIDMTNVGRWARRSRLTYSRFLIFTGTRVQPGTTLRPLRMVAAIGRHLTSRSCFRVNRNLSRYLECSRR